MAAGAIVAKILEDNAICPFTAINALLETRVSQKPQIFL
jgi:hypothetical protein